MRTLTRTAPRTAAVGALVLLSSAALVLTASSSAQAIALPVGLGGADSFAVLASSTVTNTGPSVISGDIGLHPGTSVTGFPPGTQFTGAAYAANAVSLQARTDATAAFTNASGQPGPVVIPAELGGATLSPELYDSATNFEINGTLTLDGNFDSTAIFIFRSQSTFITGSASSIVLINDANPCNVFFIVPSSATLGTGTTMVGTIIANASITATTGSNVSGRLLALNGAVTLDSTIVDSTGCADPILNDGTGVTIESINIAPLAATGVEAEGALLASGIGLAAGAILIAIARRRRQAQA